MSNTLYDADFLQTLPGVLRDDPEIQALGRVISDELHELANQTKLAIIYANIDTLPEAVLDLLAYDFKVDWYDYGYSAEEKRDTLKNSWNVHRRLGTKYAVETAISAIYKNTTVQEWWEYGGEPYRFKLLLDVTYEDLDPEKHQRVLERVEYYKNLRSHLEAVEYVVNAQGTATAYIGASVVGSYLQIGCTAKVYGMEANLIPAGKQAVPVRTVTADPV